MEKKNGEKNMKGRTEIGNNQIMQYIIYELINI